ILATIPSKVLPKFFSFGGGEVQPTSVLVTGEYDTSDGLVKGMSKEDQKRPGQMLWLLGLTRLQTQMRVIRAFQTNACTTHPTSLTTSTAERLRASYRRLQLAREREEQRSSSSHLFFLPENKKFTFYF
ncbi:unnamed protein product, partial [Brugia timori]|uniref:ATP_Ca_trans_C domain-containing protein n=1 Tax=Brugia timori TaxID=42155 RepID=A0A0R3QA60_9BILA